MFNDLKPNNILFVMVILLFVGCGVNKPTPQVEKLLLENDVNLHSVCRKYPKKLEYEVRGFDVYCDLENITENMVLWTKINDNVFEEVFKNPEEAIKWKNAGFGRWEIKQWKETGFNLQEARKWKEANIAASSVKSWQRNGFNGSSAKEWQNIGIGANHARKWIDNGFNVNDAKKWKQANIRLENIKDWVDKGFNSIEAKEWKDIYFSPLKAKKYKEAGFTVYQAKRWNNFSFDDAKKWKDAGFGVSEARDWKNMNFTIKTARKWKKLGTTASEAKKWKDASFELSEAQGWIDVGVKIDDVKKLKKAGLDIHTVSQWKKAGIEPSEIEEWYKCGVKSYKKAKYLLDKGYKSAISYCEYKARLKRIKNTKPMRKGENYVCIGGLGGLAGKFSVSIGRYSIDINGGSIFAWEEATLYKSGSFKNYTLFKGFNSEGNKRSVRVLTKYGIKKQSDINFIYDYIAMHCILVK